MKPLPFLFLLALLPVAGCSKSQPANPPSPATLPPARVTLVRVAASETAALAEITGTVRPAQRATLAARVMGAISEELVSLGQPVRTGDLLLKISAVEITARVAQAQAQLNVAVRDLARERDLLRVGASTADMVRGLEDRFTMTAAMVREAETMLGYTELRAPFDGVVARKFVQAGDLASPGQPLLELEGAGDFQIEVGIPDSLSGNLQLGVSLLAEEPAANATFQARLIELSSAADAVARTVTAKFAVPADAPVRSGQFVRVHVPAGRITALLVPISAVTTVGQMERIFIAENNRAMLRIVKTGAAHNGLVEILSGLSAGESVVVQPPANLREGQPLEVQP
ncbi:MAG: efflux RND transporter periplasmic adaptor subunit [Candidatus Didemnitutus sp.]|nr:efflux RND transporter periplasmic adaptor subunit [Candidatus Didemnitutus sp.]